MSARRRWAVVVGFLACVLSAAGGVLTWGLALVDVGNAELAAGRAGEAERHYSSAVGVAVVESWVPLFDRGVAKHHLSRWEAAAEDYRQASAVAPEGARCMIHLNWSGALEASGDELAAVEDLSGALARYQEAQLVLGLAECPTDGGALSQQWSAARERLEGKKGATPQQPEPEPEGGDDRAEALDEREQQAAEQRARAERQGDPAAGGSGQRTW